MKNNLFILIAPLLLCFTSCGEGVNSPHITMFMYSIPITGNIGNRQVIDNLCMAEWDQQSSSLSKVSKRSNTHAMVSYSVNNDSISTMSQNFQIPNDLPVYVGSVQISGSWNDLLQKGPRVQLSSISAFPNPNFWTGSNSFGTYVTSSNCSDFISTGASGNYGSVTNSGATFLNANFITCTSSFGIMCVTF